MARAGDELLNVEVADTESGLRFGAAALIGGRDVTGVLYYSRPSSAATAYGFDDHPAPFAEFFKESTRLFWRYCVVEAADDWHIGGLRGRAGTGLVPKQFERFHAGADEGQSFFATSTGEVGVFGEESVTGMDGVATGLLGDGD